MNSNIIHNGKQIACKKRYSTQTILYYIIKTIWWYLILNKKQIYSKKKITTQCASLHCAIAQNAHLHTEGPSATQSAHIRQDMEISRRLRTWHLAYRRQEKRSLARPHARAFNVRRCDRVTIKAARSIVLLVCLFRRWKINCGRCGVEKSATGVGCKFVTPLFCGGRFLGGDFGS